MNMKPNRPAAIGIESPELRPDLRAIADLVEPGTRVLDIGCGDGALLEFLRDHKQVRGVKQPAWPP